MEEKKSDSANKNPKNANLLDHHSIKHTLDESVTEIVTGRGYVEDVRLSNVRLFLGTIIIAIALFAQFYKKKFPENRDFLILCIVLYIVFNAVLQLIIFTKEKNAILFTYPPAVFAAITVGWNIKQSLLECVLRVSCSFFSLFVECFLPSCLLRVTVHG